MECRSVFCRRNAVTTIVKTRRLAKRLKIIDCESFRSLLEKALYKAHKSSAGRRPFDVVMMFKILVRQRLFNPSDDQTEYQITGRMSFQRFIGFLGECVPDVKTIWLFRDTLTQSGMIRDLLRCMMYNGTLASKGIITPRER